jgi:uncharacterized Fe-S cluster-containing radical SAM superfamily protein
MSSALPFVDHALDPAKFRDPDWTADGKPRASVALEALRTLWFNTGTLCNLTCEDCYIESSPTNDRLAYVGVDEVRGFLDEIVAAELPTEEIGLTGGEPFMNPELLDIVELCLERGFRVLVLTNAMRPMMKCADRVKLLATRYRDRLALRVSLDHYTRALHERERGPRSWQPAVAGLRWLAGNGFTVHVAGRLKWGEPEAAMRAGYRRLFDELGLAIDSADPVQLVLLPEMDETADVVEITEACWDLLEVAPEAMMCATSRMVVKRRGGKRPVVVPCTLLPYDPAFELGETLGAADAAVKLNHPHCARFCVLGGGSCTGP